MDITLYIWKREKGSDKELEELGGKILFLLQKDVKNRKGEYKRQCVMAMKKVVGVVGGGGEEAFGSVSESLLKVLECKGKSEDDDDDDDKVFFFSFFFFFFRLSFCFLFLFAEQSSSNSCPLCRNLEGIWSCLALFFCFLFFLLFFLSLACKSPILGVVF